MNISMQKEFVQEPYYIVDNEESDPEQIGEPLELVKLSPFLNHDLREMLFHACKSIIVAFANSVTSPYYTLEELDSITAKELG